MPAFTLYMSTYHPHIYLIILKARLNLAVLISTPWQQHAGHLTGSRTCGRPYGELCQWSLQADIEAYVKRCKDSDAMLVAITTLFNLILSALGE